MDVQRATEDVEIGGALLGGSEYALKLLLAGGARQLQQEISRCALFMDDGDVLEASLFAPELEHRGSSSGDEVAGERLSARVESFERREIEPALAACGGQVAAAAQRLGLHRATLNRRLKALGIEAAS